MDQGALALRVNAITTRDLYRGESAKHYEAERVRQQKWRNEQAAIAEFLAGFSAGQSVLDIPIGTGRFLQLYCAAGLNIIGMDVSEDMMHQARVKNAAADIRYGDILDIPLPDRSVDIAVCVRLLNLITENEMLRAMSELGRVVRQSIILTIRTGPQIKHKRRSITHRNIVFDATIKEIGMQVRGEKIVLPPDYRVMLLSRS